MAGDVKTREYRSGVRKAQAAATRGAILAAARDLFITEGYGCTIARIATRAGVAVDTVYASVGRKPALVLAVFDMVLGDADLPIPAAERGYVRQIRAATSGPEKITIYAQALANLLPVVAPLQEALREAGKTDPECAQAWSQLVDRRAGNMLDFARELRGTGHVREDLDDRQVADIVWATNSAEYFLLLATRGWRPDQFGAHLADMWTRTLLDPTHWGTGHPTAATPTPAGPQGR